MFDDLNYWSILIAALVNMVLGALWYSPALFGKKWMHLSGMTHESIQKNKEKMVWSYLAAFVGALLTAYVLYHLVDLSIAETFKEGAMVGFWAWLGFVVPVMAGTVLWEGKSHHLYLINVGYYLVALILMGGILAEWGVNMI